ncbi:MAG TPA: FKBP-type peptidyl-prolyl cis-trans isomerase [Candidatus Polarisedimenticolia bacterium]|nr:FKBP-type peptidyl-prolyl cis-trans isomerase [Candidatus Polarisedimenticolia bacterium]
MKSSFTFFLAVGLSLTNVMADDKPDLSVPNQKFNYALGLDIVSTFKQMDVDIDLKAFAAGMKDTLAGNPKLTEDEKKAAMDILSKNMAAKAEQLQKIASAENLKAGQAFLEANAKKEGVRVKEVVGRNGVKAELQYKILKSGPPGPSPKEGDTVEVHYVGSLIDGSVFDSSVKRGFPATFGVTEVLPGWTAALKMMKAGDKWEIFLPPSLAYGEYPTSHIGPNSTLIFEIELLSFYTPSNSTTNAPTAMAK